MITNSPYQKTTASPRTLIQPKLMVNAPNDAYEQEADAVADRVMRMPLVSSKSIGTQGMLASSVQRKCAHCEEEKKKMPVMRKADSGGGFETSPAFASQLSNTRGGGQAMPRETKSFMESRFGQDFSHVRLHTDGTAANMNRDIQAKAFTHGSDIYFNRGEFSPNTEGGKRLLAHELTHTVQQGSMTSVQSKSIQRKLNCDTEQWQDFPITVYFRRSANRDTMDKVHAEIAGARTILAKCCLRLTTTFDWSLLSGGGTFNWQSTNAGELYSQEATNLGSGHTFDTSRGLPVVVVDEVPGSGGGVTVNPQADAHYRGRNYAAIAVNQTNPNPGCNHLAHELWHVAGVFNHDAASGGDIAACINNTVSDHYCRLLRIFSSPVGDFPTPSSDTRVV